MVPVSRRDRPDVVLVVVDCARSVHPAGSRLTGPDLVAETPTDFVQYDRAVAAATWSLPSHASLFTGLYPWNHGCHNLAGLSLAPNHATIASRLRDAGYATAAFSSNCVLSPETGLLNGFTFAAWGRWSENIFRRSSTRPPHYRDLGVDASAVPLDGQPMFSAAVASTLRHIPTVGYSLNRLAHRIRGGRSAPLPPVSPWVEPSFARWLASVPEDRPIFSVVNLMDLHEPYLPDRAEGGEIPSPLRFSLVPQDGRSYAFGQGHPPLDWVSEVRDLYSEAYRSAARRIAALWDSLVAEGRAHHTLFLVTSDHGQSFGEDGWFFHSHGQPRDELTRVPLAIHYPNEFLRTAALPRRHDWVSLVDIAPTIASVVGAGSGPATDGVSLVGGTGAVSGQPALSAGDGPIQRPSERGRPTGGHRTARSATCVAYLGETKLVVSGRDPGEVEQSAFGLASGLTLSELTPDSGLGSAARRARSAVLSMLASSTDGGPSDVSRRLTTWGYG